MPGKALEKDEDTMVHFMCQRLQQTLVQKEKLRESKKNVKDIEARIRVSQPLLPIRKHSKEYDAS